MSHARARCGSVNVFSSQGLLPSHVIAELMAMSTDESVTKDLIQTLEDGKEGFAKGADKLESSSEPQLAATFRRYIVVNGFLQASL